MNRLWAGFASAVVVSLAVPSLAYANSNPPGLLSSLTAPMTRLLGLSGAGPGSAANHTSNSNLARSGLEMKPLSKMVSSLPALNSTAPTPSALNLSHLRTNPSSQSTPSNPAVPNSTPQNSGTQASASKWTPEPAKYGIVEQSNVPIRMSDGTVLMADVYRPANLSTGQAAAGKFPVILTQTPYRKSGPLTIQGGDGYYPYLIKRGYINAIVDVRGTGSSQGTWKFLGPREVQDGVELVNWCAHDLQGSNGKVGLAGASYLGINQLLIAGAVGKDSPLKAIFPVIAGNDLYRDTAFQGGIPDTEFSLPWLGLRAGLDMLPSDNTVNDPVGAAQVAMQHAGSLLSFDAPFLTGIETGGSASYDGTWWQQRAPRNALQNIVANGIPAFMVGGWFDLFQRGEVLNYSGLQNAWDGRSVRAPMTANQPVTGRYQLVMGPWYHLTATVGQKLQELQLEWFDTWLKNEPTGMADTPTPLHLFELGSQKWVNTNRYPMTQGQVQTYYFGPGRTGTAVSINDGSLTSSRPATMSGSDMVAWTGVTTPLGRQSEQWSMGASTYLLQMAGLPPLPNTQDDRGFEAAGLTYTTKPFPRPEVLAGPIDASIYATSTTTNAEFVVTVEDVAPNGQAYPLTSGALLGSFRTLDPSLSWRENGKLVLPYHPYTQVSEKPVVPGKITCYDIEVFPTFEEVHPGHRLRITITTSDTPHLTPTLVQTQQLAGGVYRIERTSPFPSHVNFTLASPSDFASSAVSWGPSGS
ncbi:CocE/NonD family hydrolase [Alicyclobacillus tolerans]|uniref:CocE/NonD family hydrolase n=1 Tax=Alicyclobacillus tolerans TaxID=90970 RepID=UPI001F0269ED|nr:CocE/NonD family hydrolase [Alicyclobacillus tolerans]MCF8564201.1 CocE/NonD family hydrolase [Alicyclobacillus tolerans]